MFGLSELIGSPQNEIPLVTSKNNRIGNTQGAKVAIGRVLAFRDMCATRPNWRIRRDSFGLYNCAGLVWATRRTGISQNEDWLKILADDGYRQVSEPQLDDLVLYRNSDDRTFLHVARIVGFEKGISETSPKIPIVLSKWGHDLGECVHFDHDHGIDNSYNVSIEYWTERPNDEQPIRHAARIALR
ncbi:MAG: hypothetical protein ABL888_06810 [Pirellulaceae bacterium]